MKRADIGAALSTLDADVRAAAADLVAQYRRYGHVEVLKQAIDTPHRARAQLAAWISRYEAVKGAGTANAFLASCLTAAGATRTLAQLNQSLVALETAAQQFVTQRAGGATWDQVADALTAAFQATAPESEDLSYQQLPIPAGYVTVWGDPW